MSPKRRRRAEPPAEPAPPEPEETPLEPLDALGPELPAPAGATEADVFLSRADRLATRLAELTGEVGALYGRLRAGTLDEAAFMAHGEPLGRRILDLDRRLPVPPAACLGEEAALLLALQAAANAVLQFTSDTSPARREPLHHPSFQVSLRKCGRHLSDYHRHRSLARPAPPPAPEPP